MRSLASLAFTAMLGIVCVAGAAHAQIGPMGDGGGGGPGNPGEPGGPGSPPTDTGGSGEDAQTQRRNEEWGIDQHNAALPQLRNAGPCPYVKVLYDAARYVELRDNQANAEAVGFTGEIDNLSSACEYKSNDPIKVQARLLFELGRGPAASGEHKVYRYWIAVTDRNRAVIDKEYFDLPVDFPAGQDRVQKIEDITDIVIPRANLKVSGANFEVLVGFDVTQQMADFNHDGERFRVNAGVTTAQNGR